MAAPQRRLGELLVSAGILDAGTLARGIELQRENGEPLLDTLIRHQLVDERAALRCIAEVSGARYIATEKLRQARLEPDLLDRVPARHAEKLEVLPLSFAPATGTLTLAVASLDPGLLEQVRLAAGVRVVVPIIASRPGLKAAIRRFYYGDIYAFAELDQPELRAVLKPEPAGEVLAREESKVVRAPRADGETRLFGQGSAQQPGDDPSALEQLRRENRLLRLAVDLQGHLAGEHDPAALLQRVLAFSFDHLAADNGVLLEVLDGGALRPIGVRSRVAESGELSVSETLVREVVETRQGVLTGDALSDARFNRAESVVAAGLRSAMGAPLLLDGEVRGVLFLDTRADVFSDEHLQMLMTIAAQASRALEGAELMRRTAEARSTRALLARSFPPSQVDLIATGKLSLPEVGEQREATVLVAGICGFRTLAASLAPDVLVALLNEHYEHLADVVFAHGGTLDRFAGDALVALWGVPLAADGSAAQALHAALEMMARTDRLNELRERAERPGLQLRIGVDTGPVIYGAIGSSHRLEPTAFGEALDTAWRLTELAGPSQIIASDAALAAAGERFTTRPLATIQLDGGARKLGTHEVKGPTTEEA